MNASQSSKSNQYVRFLQKVLSKENSLLFFLESTIRESLLSPEEEYSLATAIENGGVVGEEARNKMVVAHMRMVAPIAYPYSKIGVSLDDLIQEGYLGLLMATTKFDRHCGVRFSAYARWYIRAFIKDFAYDNHSIVRVPSGKRKLRYAFKQAMRKLQELSEPNSTERIADLMNISTDEVCRLAKLAIVDVSLNETVSIKEDLEEDETQRESTTELGYLLADDSCEKQENLMIAVKRKEALRASLEFLDERQRAVIVGRFGLDDEEPLRLEDLAKRFGISAEAIRLIEEKALKKLSRRKKLRAFH